ncbi:DNA-binding domain-containing protein [Xanthomonas campestris]|uniref:DNA-binding domain-containing protein n=1 Tax=Xanthomonas campestris TaxID=339 RepID=UPI001CD643BD
MVQPCSPALPPGPSVPQLAGWSLPSDAAMQRRVMQPKPTATSAEVKRGAKAKHQTYRNQQR